MIPVTYFKAINLTTPEAYTSLEQILNEIRTGRWKAEIMACRENPELKRTLPCFTPAGIFNHRSKAGLISYNGVLTLDIDYVGDPTALKEECKKIAWVYAAFITPSGKGLKICIRTQSTVDTYRETEEAACSEIKRLTGYERDKNCKDISRAHYVSWDPDLYVNPQSEFFKKNPTPP